MLIWMDGFDAYGTAGVNVSTALDAAGYTLTANNAGDGSPTILGTSNTATGVGYALNVATWPYGGNITRNFLAAGTVVVGVRINMQTGQFLNILKFGYNNLLGNPRDQILVAANGANGITVQTADANFAYFSGPNVLFEGVWQYVDIEYVPGATGSIQVRVDGVVVLSVSGVPTASTWKDDENVVHTLPNSVNYVSLTSNNSNVWWADDFYILNGDGSDFNVALGDVVVHVIPLLADAGTNQMTQVGGTTGEHFTSVNEITPDGNTSYLYSNTGGQKELFTLSAFPADMVDVLAVSVNIEAKKSEPGAALYQAVIVSGGVELDGPQQSAPLTYAQTQFITTTAPGGGGWSLTSAQNAEVGVLIG